MGATAERGELKLQRAPHTADDVSVLISLSQQVNGIVIIGMSEKTGISVVSKILGETFEELDELAKSGIGELGNVITGLASTGLSEVGYEVKISPPTLIQGKGTLISTLDFYRVVVPIKTELGDIHLYVALTDTPI